VGANINSQLEFSNSGNSNRLVDSKRTECLVDAHSTAHMVVVL
jgi:hypothetical protein